MILITERAFTIEEVNTLTYYGFIMQFVVGNRLNNSVWRVYVQN